MKNWNIKYVMTEELLKQAIDLDKSVFEDNDIGDFNKCKEWLNINKEIYTILLFNNKVVGYINFMPITRDCYCKIKKGELKDYQINISDILPFEKDKEYNCLMTSIVIHKEFRNGIAVQRLWNGFKDKLLAFKKRNIKISLIIMDCVTDIGEKCAINYLNAKYVCNSNGGKIYEGYLDV